MKKLFLIVSLCLFLCGCSAHMYNASNHNVTETQIVLDKANFKVVGPVQGTAKATYIFGIGGLSKKSLKGNAIADMYKNANLTDSQAVINVNCKQRASIILFAGKVEYTATGTIIEFIE